MLRICDQGEASIYTGGLRGRKLHNEILALPRRKRNRKCQTADTKASPVDRGLANRCAGGAYIGKRRDLRAAAADLRVHRDAVRGDGNLREGFGEAGTSGNSANS